MQTMPGWAGCCWQCALFRREQEDPHVLASTFARPALLCQSCTMYPLSASMPVRRCPHPTIAATAGHECHQFFEGSKNHLGLRRLGRTVSPLKDGSSCGAASTMTLLLLAGA